MRLQQGLDGRARKPKYLVNLFVEYAVSRKAANVTPKSRVNVTSFGLFGIVRLGEAGDGGRGFVGSSRFGSGDGCRWCADDRRSLSSLRIQDVAVCAFHPLPSAHQTLNRWSSLEQLIELAAQMCIIEAL